MSNPESKNNKSRSTTIQEKKMTNHHHDQEVAVPVSNEKHHHPFGFDLDFIDDSFNRALNRFSRRFGFSDSLFFNNGDVDFESHFSRMLAPFKREFMNEFSLKSSPSFFRHDNDLSKYTQKLFNEFTNDEKKNRNNDKSLSEEEHPDDEILKHPKELEDLYTRFRSSEGSNNNSNSAVSGRSFVSSTIMRNGKSVTVSKHSELTPDGTIKTRVDQKLRDHDHEGHDQTKSWEKNFSLDKNKQDKMIENKSN